MCLSIGVNSRHISTCPIPDDHKDEELGAHIWFNNARYYDASTGRYISSDPIGLAGGINSLGMLGGNPISRIDLFGMAECDVKDMTELAEANNPDMNIVQPSMEAINPDRLTPNRYTAGYVSSCPGARPVINSLLYGGELTPAGRVELYNTIVHENWHADKQSFVTRSWNSRESEARREANRRTDAAKNQILNSGAGSCGCSK